MRARRPPTATKLTVKVERAPPTARAERALCGVPHPISGTEAEIDKFVNHETVSGEEVVRW
jgi:hypothetical protein